MRLLILTLSHSPDLLLPFGAPWKSVLVFSLGSLEIKAGGRRKREQG